MQERERRRVLQRFNPDAIRQVAESTADELTRARLLAIVGENLRRTGADRSPQQQKALEELNKASHQSVGARRVRYVAMCLLQLLLSACTESKDWQPLFASLLIVLLTHCQ